RIEWDYGREPGEPLTGGEFMLFEPLAASKFYLFNTRLDIVPPAGHVIRTEPHPRYFTDDSGTVPLAMIGHVQAEWFSRLLFVVFRAPRPGERHVFRNGEPYAQLLFVPRSVTYEALPIDADELAQRRRREDGMDRAKLQVADNVWRNPAGATFCNH